MDQVIIIGGGVIGLTAAYELCQAGFRVRVLDQAEPGQEASWAGAGMIPPGAPGSQPVVLQQLATESTQLWSELSERLREETGIDNGYRVCGAVHLATAFESLVAQQADWQAGGVDVELLDHAAVRGLIPPITESVSHAIHLPRAAQVRNPWHLLALRTACERSGVEILAQHAVREIVVNQGRVSKLKTTHGVFRGQQILVTAGAWSADLLDSVGCSIDIGPVRGQIVLLKSDQPLFRVTLEQGPRYLVMREDGHVLIGSTEEWVGFEKRNTVAGIAGLCQFASELIPGLDDLTLQRCWSGLRPHAPRGLPYVGQVPGLKNLFVAAGHFRAGLSNSPATARLICDLLLGREVNPVYKALGVGRPL
ncbi:MAG: glycine oxidase ThiO [Planctomycetaceae bacterium]|nr:glycine oxidase ThiO [Planctomycetaceae bacterium]